MLIDTHCHLNFKDYKDDYQIILNQALMDNIWVINVGTQIDTSKRAIAIAENYDKGVYAIIGLHPIHLHSQEVEELEQNLDFHSRGEKFDIAAYKELAKSEKVVGIGEMGIDYFHIPAHIDLAQVKQEQKVVFCQGLDMARELNLPVTVHTRPSQGTVDAYDDVLEVIKESGYNRCVIHCFGGSLEQAKKFIDLGCLISVTGIVTFKNAKDLHQIVTEIPLEKIMIETDAPYLTPEPYRGQRNNPVYVKYVVEKIAALRGLSVIDVANITTATAKEFFNIKD